MSWSATCRSTRCEDEEILKTLRAVVVFMIPTHPPLRSQLTAVRLFRRYETNNAGFSEQFWVRAHSTWTHKCLPSGL